MACPRDDRTEQLRSNFTLNKNIYSISERNILRITWDDPMDSVDHILTSLSQYFAQQAIPAWQLDCDANLLQETLQTIAGMGCFRLKTTQKYGGLACDEAQYHQFKQTIVQYSGALTFLQHQHQGAIRTIASSQSDAIKARYIPQLMAGELLVGVGISQLRQRQNCSLKGIETHAGYRVMGSLPWASGYKHFKKIIIGFVTAANEAVYAIIPFNNKNSQKFGQITCSNVLPLIVAQSTNTVNISFYDYFIHNDDIVLFKSAENFFQDNFVTLNNSSFHIGLALAALKLIRPFIGSKHPMLADIATNAEREIFTYTSDVIQALSSGNFDNFLILRARGIELSNNLTRLACLMNKGQCILQTNPAQRLYRECLLFNSFGSSDKLVEQCLQVF